MGSIKTNLNSNFNMSFIHDHWCLGTLIGPLIWINTIFATWIYAAEIIACYSPLNCSVFFPRLSFLLIRHCGQNKNLIYRSKSACKQVMPSACMYFTTWRTNAPGTSGLREWTITSYLNLKLARSLLIDLCGWK